VSLASVSAALAVVLAAGFVVLLTIHLGQVSGRRVPWGLAAGAAVAVCLLAVAVAYATRTRGVAWTLREGAESTLAALVVGAVLLAGLLRLAGARWVAAALVAEAMLVVAVTSWMPVRIAPHWGSPDLATLTTCFTTSWRWGTYGRFGVFYDVIPNVLLYVPLGAALAAARRRHRWLAVPVAIAVTLGTESYQALFTDRECAGNDVLTNTTGAMLGVVLLLAAELVLLRRRR